MSNDSVSGVQDQEKQPTQNDLDGLLLRLVHHCWWNDRKGRQWQTLDDISLAKCEGVTSETMTGWKVTESGADMGGLTAKTLIKAKFVVKKKGRFRPTPAGVKRSETILTEQGPRLASDDQIKDAVRDHLSARPPREEWIALHPDEPMTLDFVDIADDGTKVFKHEIIAGSSQRIAAEMTADRHPRCGGVPVADLPGHVVAALCKDGLAAGEFKIESVVLGMIHAGVVERIEAGAETAYLDLRGEERREDVWRLTVATVTAASEQDQAAAEIVPASEVVPKSDKLSIGMAILTRNPELTNIEIAKRAQVNPSTLYRERWSSFRKLRRALKANPPGVTRQGSRAVDKDTGHISHEVRPTDRVCIECDKPFTPEDDGEYCRECRLDLNL